MDARILLLLFTPFFLALILGIALFFTLGTWWVEVASSGIENSVVADYLSREWQLIEASTLSSISHILLLVLTALVLLPVAYLLSVILTSLVLLPFILRILEKKNFSMLEKKHGGRFTVSVWNTLKVSGIYFLMLVITLPLWLVPGLAIVVPVLLTAYLNKNIFVYDVLEDFASAEERHQIAVKNRRLLYILGIILGLVNYLPLAFVVAPTFASLAYSYFCLNELKDLRSNRS